MPKLIDTDEWSSRWREAGIDLEGQRVLITNFHGSEQEPDLSEPPNCDGFGRIRHFRLKTNAGWPRNPLPIEPASNALGIPVEDVMRAQVFQNAVCNWRCWYCFVPFNLLSANQNHSALLTAGEMLDLYLDQPTPPKVIDLTGGQPDLAPEWIPWMIREIQARGLENSIYLWSDDNLSTDYFWQYLPAEDIDLVRQAKNYGRVCCFKGFDEESFTFNTLADQALFSRQFELIRRFIDLGIDLYAYVTLTSDSAARMSDRVRLFVDRLQDIHDKLPLRTVPLEIQVFSPVQSRLRQAQEQALCNQRLAVEAWNRELSERFTWKERNAPITSVSLSTQTR